jgi:hypothetical protein
VKPILLSIGILCGLAFSSCVGQQPNRDTSTALRTSDVLPHCTEDRRPSYTVLEMPPISNAGNAPQPYLEALYQTIQKQVEKRAVWKVVSVSDTIEDVVVFNISMLSWKNDLDASDLKRRIEMKLSLVDKFLGCEVNETTGQGQVLVDSSGHGIENGVADVADGAGWFVENVLLHNQYN